MNWRGKYVRAECCSLQNGCHTPPLVGLSGHLLVFLKECCLSVIAAYSALGSNWSVSALAPVVLLLLICFQFMISMSHRVRLIDSVHCGDCNGLHAKRFDE